MQQNRPKLSLNLGSREKPADEQPIQVVKHALTHDMCVRATYNRVGFILSPQILYERHGEAYLDAVAVERGGNRPPETKLAIFKLSGLRDVAMTSEPAARFPGLDRQDARYGEHVIAVIGH